MAGTTKNLGLALLGVSAEDKSVTFEEWRTSINGEAGASNMHLIDGAIAEDRQRISELENQPFEGVKEINGKTGERVTLTAADVHARSDEWIPEMSDIDGLQEALDNAGSVKTWNGIAPDENGNISAQVVDVDLSGSEESNGEPKKPLYALRIGGQLFYPVTSADQIILSNGEKLEIGGKLNIPTLTVNGIEAVGNNITLTAQSVGALYIDEDGVIEDDGVVQTLNADTLAGMTYEQLKADIAQNIDIDIDPEDIGAATSGHTHTQYVEINSSPTFNVVTANKIIGAVYQ